MVRSNTGSPAMYDLFTEVKMPLYMKDICPLCIREQKVELLRHILPRLDAHEAFDALCQVPWLTVTNGAFDMLDMLIKELKMIRVERNAFVVAHAGHHRVVPFEVEWLERNLVEAVTRLEHLGIDIVFSNRIGYNLLYDSNPGFLDYLEEKGIDYRDLVGENDFEKLF